MDVKKIIEEIDNLPEDEKMGVYLHLASKLRKREAILTILEKYRGKAEGLWETDAQKYVNQLRTDDRF